MTAWARNARVGAAGAVGDVGNFGTAAGGAVAAGAVEQGVKYGGGVAIGAKGGEIRECCGGGGRRRIPVGARGATQEVEVG